MTNQVNPKFPLKAPHTVFVIATSSKRRHSQTAADGLDGQNQRMNSYICNAVMLPDLAEKLLHNPIFMGACI